MIHAGTTDRVFSPGFRLSKFDVVVLVLGTIAAGIAAAIEWWVGYVIALVIGHFFSGSSGATVRGG